MSFTPRPATSDGHALSRVFDFESATSTPQRLHFSKPCALELAWQADEVLPALQRIEQQQGRQRKE